MPYRSSIADADLFCRHRSIPAAESPAPVERLEQLIEPAPSAGEPDNLESNY